jgi:hypothetical protein
MIIILTCQMFLFSGYMFAGKLDHSLQSLTLIATIRSVRIDCHFVFSVRTGFPDMRACVRSIGLS